MKKKNKQTFINEETSIEPEFEQLTIDFDDAIESIEQPEIKEEEDLKKVLEEPDDNTFTDDSVQRSIFDEQEVEEDEPHEIKVKKKLEELRKDVKSLDDLISYIELIKNEYNCGYGEAPRAIAQAALATAWYLSGEFGITGFQAGCVMWDFITGWEFTNNKCGMRIVDYDEMLYPQYAYKFKNQGISKSVWDSLQSEAVNNINKEVDYAKKHNGESTACSAVIDHWRKIASGKVPFNCYIVEDY